MSEFRKFPGQDHAEWLDEAAAAELAREVLANAGAYKADLVLHPDAADLLDATADQRKVYVEHWLIMGVWLTAILASVWRLLL